MAIDSPPQSKPRCSFEHCDALVTGCDLGIKPLADCPQWKARTIVGDVESQLPANIPLPWAGASLGMDDLNYIAARTAPRLIGVIGGHNAGKTTLLVAWYLLLCRGQRLPGRLPESCPLFSPRKYFLFGYFEGTLTLSRLNLYSSVLVYQRTIS
jgi:hypothetical protein